MWVTRKISMRIMTFISAIILAASLAGCGGSPDNNKSSNEQIKKNEVKTEKPEKTGEEQDFDKYIKLGSYKHVVDVNMDITDEEIDEMIDGYLQIYANTADHMKQGTIEKGMLVNMNYTITISDGSEEPEDGSGDFIIGSDEIAPIDMLLVGKQTGDICEFEVSFPADDDKYPGKKGKVQVTINYINGGDALPEADDEFIKNLTNGTFDNLNDFKEYLRETRKQNLIVQYGQEAIQAVVANSEFISIEKLCKEEFEKIKHEMYQYGISFDMEQKEIWEIFGYEDEKTFDEYLEQHAEEYVKEKLVIYSLADIYGVSVTDDEVAELKKQEEQYYTDDESNTKFDESYARYSILKQKTLEALLNDQ